MPTKAEIIAELERRKSPAAPAAPVAKPPADAIRAELARRAAKPSFTPFGGTGEWDLKAFEGVNSPQSNPVAAHRQQNDDINAGIEEAAAAIPGGYAAFQKQGPDPERMRAMGYVPDPLAKGGYTKAAPPKPTEPANPGFEWTLDGNQWVQRSALSADTSPNLLNDIGRGLSAPFQKNENLRTIAGAPLNFGHGLGQGGQALINNTMAVGTDVINSGLNAVDPNRAQFERPRIDVFDKNTLLDEGGLLASDAGMIPRVIGQVSSTRVPIGKASPGGSFGHMAAKDAAAITLSTDYAAPRLSDMISSETPVLGPVADLLRSHENDPAIVSMMKNLGEDLTLSSLTAGILKLVDAGYGAVRPNAAAAKGGQDPRLDPAVAAQIRRVLANEPAGPAEIAPVAARPAPFSAAPEPSGPGIVRRNADRIVTGGVGATLGGAGDAFAAPGDGSDDGEGGPPMGAATGAAIGLFGPRAVASAASRGFRAAARSATPRAARAGFDERVAARAVRNALKTGGITTPEQAAAAMTARYGDKPASVADLTQEGVGTAAGLSRLPGATGEAARARGEDLLQNRGGRLERDIGDATGVSPATIAGDVDRMVQLAQQQAKPAYDSLRARFPLGSLNSPRLEQLRELDILTPHLRGVDRYRETLAATEGRVVGDFEYWDLVKRSLDDAEQAAVARNQPVPYDLDSARQAIVREMDQLIPDYPAARQLGGEAPKMRDAFKQGQGLLGGRYTAEDVTRLAEGITGQRLTAMQAGVIRSMVAKTEGARGAMASLMSPGARQKLAQVFGPEAADAMQARFAADAAIVNNAHRINPNVGSVTSQAQMGGGNGLLPMAAEAIRAARNPVEAALAAMSKSGSYTKAQRDLMGQMLLDGVTPENLARIFRSNPQRGGAGRRGPRPPPAPPANALATQPATPPAPRPPLPGQTSNSPAALGGAIGGGVLTGGVTYAATGDEDLALKAGAVGAIGGGVLGNRLGKLGSGPKPPKGAPAPSAPVNASGPVPTIDGADLRPAVARNAPAPAPKAPAVPKIGQTQSVANVTTKDGRVYDVTAEVFKDRDAAVMSPAWPGNELDDLTDAIKHQQSSIRAEARGMKLANDAPTSPKWSEQNPQEWADVQRQVGERFLGLVNSTPGPHILALVDDVDINSLATLIEDGLPKGKVLMKSAGNGELAVVDRAKPLPPQFERGRGNTAANWETYSNLRFNQRQGILPPPADWATAKPAPTSPKSPGNVTPIKPPPVKNGFGSSSLPMDEASRPKPPPSNRLAKGPPRKPKPRKMS